MSDLYHYLFLSTVVKICRRQEYLKKDHTPKKNSRVQQMRLSTSVVCVWIVHVVCVCVCVSEWRRERERERESMWETESLGKRAYLIHTREEGRESIFQIILTSLLRKTSERESIFQIIRNTQNSPQRKRHILAHTHERPGKTLFGVCLQGYHDPRWSWQASSYA